MTEYFVPTNNAVCVQYVVLLGFIQAMFFSLSVILGHIATASY